MKVVVITGSTRGIGRGLAQAFLELGCAVTISGRTQVAVEQAVQELSVKYEANRIQGLACDVTQFAQVQALWQYTKGHFGTIDIWINNAGISHPVVDFWQHDPQQFEEVVQTNLIGMLNGIHVALNGMLAQGHGALYNMEGLGSDGRIINGMALYGSTKAALGYLDRSLARQLVGKSVLVGAIAPGMVVTDMVMDQFKGRQQDFARAKRVFNIIAERVETVTPILAKKILANQKNGVRIRYSGSVQTTLKFLIAPFRKRNLFEDFPQP
jgi:NAD(P)-dependent dehydrogenase (short-subunit alcohol dehydrogenase family)